MAAVLQTVRRWVFRGLERRGPAVRCTRCGRPLFRGIAMVSRGQVKLIGADTALVRVDFDTTSRLGFRHVDLGACRLPVASDDAAHRSG